MRLTARHGGGTNRPGAGCDPRGRCLGRPGQLPRPGKGSWDWPAPCLEAGPQAFDRVESRRLLAPPLHSQPPGPLSPVTRRGRLAWDEALPVAKISTADTIPTRARGETYSGPPRRGLVPSEGPHRAGSARRPRVRSLLTRTLWTRTAGRSLFSAATDVTPECR